MSATLQRSISSNFYSLYQLSFPQLTNNSIGFIASSLPLSKYKSITAPPPILDQPDQTPFLLYSRLSQTLQIESLYARRLSPSNILILSGLTHWKEGLSHGNVQIISNPVDELTMEALYMTDNQTLGGNALVKVSRNWALGLEVCFWFLIM